MDDGIGADFQPQCARLHVDQETVGELFEIEGGVFRNPLGRRRGCENGEEKDTWEHWRSLIKSSLFCCYDRVVRWPLFLQKIGCPFKST